MSMRETAAAGLLLLMTLMQVAAADLPASGPDCESCTENDFRRAPEIVAPVLIPEPASELVRKDRVLAAAYFDTMRILSSVNKCSSFFGGSQASMNVFSNFMAGIRKSYLPPRVGVKMSGEYTNVLNARTNVSYRLFDNAFLNAEGPFYRRTNSPNGIAVFEVGSFQPNSREARILMLLHELGHLMKGTDGNWLLPDDGASLTESFTNTRKIESICGEEIRSLARRATSLESLAQSNLSRTVSPAAATSGQQ